MSDNIRERLLKEHELNEKELEQVSGGLTHYDEIPSGWTIICKQIEDAFAYSCGQPSGLPDSSGRLACQNCGSSTTGEIDGIVYRFCKRGRTPAKKE